MDRQNTAYNEASDALTVCPYAVRLEAWLNRHLDRVWPPVDPTASAALVRALSEADTAGQLVAR